MAKLGLETEGGGEYEIDYELKDFIDADYYIRKLVTGEMDATTVGNHLVMYFLAQLQSPQAKDRVSGELFAVLLNFIGGDVEIAGQPVEMNVPENAPTTPEGLAFYVRDQKVKCPVCRAFGHEDCEHCGQSGYVTRARRLEMREKE